MVLKNLFKSKFVIFMFALYTIMFGYVGITKLHYFSMVVSISLVWWYSVLFLLSEWYIARKEKEYTKFCLSLIEYKPY